MAGVDSASKNEYQDIPGGKGGRCIGVTTLPPSCAECQEIWDPSRPRRPVTGIKKNIKHVSTGQYRKIMDNNTLRSLLSDIL